MLLSRKQQWRRVKSRRRIDLIRSAGEPALTTPKETHVEKGPGADVRDPDDDEASTKTGAISSWSSFDSVGSDLEVQDACQEDEGHRGGTRRAKIVSFQPRVEVFLVTHKSELDKR